MVALANTPAIRSATEASRGSDVNMALPRPSDSRGLVSISSRMSSTIYRARGSEDTTFCMVPQCFLSSALDRSVMPLVLASNHLSTLSGEGIGGYTTAIAISWRGSGSGSGRVGLLG